jgi:hypothetical protein
MYIYIFVYTYPNMSFIHVQICESNMICPQSDLELKSECPKPSSGTRIFLDFVDSTRRLEESWWDPCSRLEAPRSRSEARPGLWKGAAERDWKNGKTCQIISQDRMIYCKEMEKWKFRKKMGGKFYMFR